MNYDLKNYELVPVGGIIKEGAIFGNEHSQKPVSELADGVWFGRERTERMCSIWNLKPVTDLLREPAEMPDCEGSMVASNPIRPDHYKLLNGKDTIDIMAETLGNEAAINFCMGNALKYITRAGKKEGNSFEQDLSKATEYLNRAIKLNN